MAEAIPPQTATGGYIDTGLSWLEKAAGIYTSVEQARRSDIEYSSYDAVDRASGQRPAGASTGLMIAAGLALAAFFVVRAMR